MDNTVLHCLPPLCLWKTCWLLPLCTLYILCSCSLPWVNFVIFITSFHEDGVVFVMCLYPSPSNVRCGTIHLSPRNQKSVLQKLRRTKTLTLTSENIHRRLRSTQRSAGGRWSPHYFGCMDVWTYGWYYASGRAYVKKQKIHKLNSETSEKYIAWVAAIMLDEKKNKNKRVAAMKNVVPKTEEKPDADYAIAVAAHGERNPMQDLNRVGSTRIREKHQGAEVGRYCLCRYCDIDCEYTLDKTTRKFIPNTAYGSFRDYSI